MIENNKILLGRDAPSPSTGYTHENLCNYLKNICSDEELQEIMYSNSQKVYSS